MDDCEFYPNCLGHYAVKVHGIVVYVHLFPWYPVIDVLQLLRGGSWVNVLHSRWDYCRDYEFELWWVLKGQDWSGCFQNSK